MSWSQYFFLKKYYFNFFINKNLILPIAWNNNPIRNLIMLISLKFLRLISKLLLGKVRSYDGTNRKHRDNFRIFKTFWIEVVHWWKSMVIIETSLFFFSLLLLPPPPVKICQMFEVIQKDFNIKIEHGTTSKADTF